MGVMEKIKKAFTKEVATVDPALFNSELANQTAWEPSTPGEGANFCTCRLQCNMNNGDWAFAPTGMSKCFGLFFSLVGVGLFIVGLLAFAGVIDIPITPAKFALTIFGLVFAVAGFFVNALINAKVVFSQEAQGFFCTRKNPQKIDVTMLDSYVPFKGIGALQLLEKYIQGSGKNSSSYYAYELNIVKKDGSRVHVLSHGVHPKLHEDAENLAQNLRVPLWDVKAICNESTSKDA